MAFGLMDNRNKELDTPLGVNQNMDSALLDALEQQRATQRWIQENMNTKGYINLPPAQSPTPFKPIRTDFNDRWLDRYRPRKPITPPEERAPAPVDDHGGPDDMRSERGAPYAWEDWGPLSRGAGMNPSGTGFMDSFRNAKENARIGLSQGLPGMLSNPLDDPGWQSVMAANGWSKEAMSSYFSTPSKPMAQTYQDALKQHSYMGLTQMDSFRSHKDTKTAMENIVSSSKTYDRATGAYGFDRASYMSQLDALNPAYAQTIASVNNARMTETMYGAMALSSETFRGTAFSSVEVFNAMPSYAFDVIQAVSKAAPDVNLSDFAKSHNFANVIDSMSPTQQFQYVSALRDNPTMATDISRREAALARAATAMKVDINKRSEEDHAAVNSLDGVDRGKAASQAAREELGISRDTSFSAAIDAGTVTTEQVTDALAAAYGHKDRDSAPAAPDSPKGDTAPEGPGVGSDGGDTSPDRSGLSDAEQSQQDAFDSDGPGDPSTDDPEA